MSKENAPSETRDDYIPKELLKMLELPYGYSLLIKGEGGVGK